MEFKEYLEEVSVIGALGKMGRGIAALLLELMAFENRDFRLNLIDINLKDDIKVLEYLREHLKKQAEKKIIFLRGVFKDRKNVVSNEEIISLFLQESLAKVRISSEIGLTKNSYLVFEAALEEVDFKVNLFKEAKKVSAVNGWFFTNTSSIPIHILNEKASLDSRIIGFHFYNPPVIQTLMEIIPLKEGKLKNFSIELAKKLKKEGVFSNDRAGFIGNGHFIREIKLALELHQKLASKMPSETAIAALNDVTKGGLLRPMGIFELMDYVGLEVCQNIGSIMSTYGNEKYDLSFLKDKKKITPENNPSIDFLEISPLYSWKTLSKEKNPRELENKIEEHFKALFKKETYGGKLAHYYLEQSVEFCQALVDSKVANDLSDVSTVLKKGFYHLYSPSEVMHAVS